MDEQSDISKFEDGDSLQVDQHECDVCGRLFDSKIGRGAHMSQSHDEEEIKTELIIRLQRLAHELERTPTGRDMEQQGEYSVSTYENRFDSWNEALRKAGLEITKRHDIAKQELLDELTRLADVLGRVPFKQDMKQDGGYGTSVYRRKFGSWNNALKEACLDPTQKRNIPKSDLLDELRNLTDVLGRIPTSEDMRKEGVYGVKVYQTKFRSWNKALKQAGLEVRREIDISRSKLLDELRDLANRLGRTPRKNELTLKGEYGFSTYQREFGSWNKALKEAGLEINKEHNISTSQSWLVETSAC